MDIFPCLGQIALGHLLEEFVNFWRKDPLTGQNSTLKGTGKTRSRAQTFIVNVMQHQVNVSALCDNAQALLRSSFLYQLYSHLDD